MSLLQATLTWASTQFNLGMQEIPFDVHPFYAISHDSSSVNLSYSQG